MLLCVIDVVTTELMRPLLMKPTVSFDVRNTGKNLCIRVNFISVGMWSPWRETATCHLIAL